MHSKSMRLIGAVAAAALLATACGSDEGSEGTAGATATPADDPTTSAPEEDAPPTAGAVEDVLAGLVDLDPDEQLAELERGALEEGAVLLYGSSNIDLQEAWAEDFQELYPEINMLYVRSKSGDILERVRAESVAERHLVDVIAVNTVVGAELLELDLVAGHLGVPIPDGYPERYVEEFSAPYQINPNLLAWNTDLVPAGEEPTGLDDLLDPRWKGKVAIDVGGNNFVAGLVAARGREGAADYLTRLVVDNEALVRSGHPNITALLAAGEFPVAAELYGHELEGLREEGAPLDWIAPEPTAANLTSVYLYKQTQRPHAAALLMRYLLSERGGQMLADTGRIPIHPAAELEFAGLEPFLEEGSPESEALLPITTEVSAEVFEIADELIEEILVPAYQE